MPWRKVPRDVNEEARDHARALMGTPQFEKSRDERKRVEIRFAHLKTHHRFERMRLRGLTGARDEFHLAVIVQNLKTLANHIWRPPPDEPASYTVTEQDCDIFDKGFQKCCDQTNAHDSSRGRNASPPTPIEMLADIQAVRTWSDNIRERQKKIS
jgi:hypothetical protein